MMTLEDLDALRESLYTDERNAIGALEDIRHKLRVWFGETRQDEENRSLTTHNALAAILLQQQAQSFFPPPVPGSIADLLTGFGTFGSGQAVRDLIPVSDTRPWYRRIFS